MVISIIHTSKVKYVMRRGKPYLWVPESEPHNVVSCPSFNCCIKLICSLFWLITELCFLRVLTCV